MIGKEFQELVDIMAKLRGSDGCPWDREQTHDSLKPYLLEEAYEVLESLDHENMEGLEEELGDLLLQTIFHAQIADEEKRFSIFNVLKTLKEKLIRRHPHVFGDAVINTASEQKIHWENLKKKEGKTSVIDGVPRNLPSLLRAHRIQQKAATVGFDWEKVAQVWDKVDEEMLELKSAIKSGKQELVKEEFGDLLFALVNLSRFLHINPEDSLRQAIEKFIHRFHQLEKRYESEEKKMRDSTLKEMDHYWNKIKDEESRS